MKKIIITSSDSKYFQLLKELIDSIQKHNLTNIFDIGILDTGLSNDQIQYLSKLGIIVTNAEWNIQFPKYKIRGREYLKNIIARAFLPDYFQGYSTYIWIDADTWINDKQTFMLFDEGCKSNSICITPQVDRSYGRLANVEWFFGIPKKIKTINYKNISRSVSYKLAKKYALFPTLNGGVFSINDDAVIWKNYQKNMKIASRNGRIFGTDQVALVLSVFEDSMPVQFLPAYTNWMCEFHLPIFDLNRNIFLEPYLPYHPIGIMHLAGLDDIRSNKNIFSKIKTNTGNTINKSLRFIEYY